MPTQPFTKARALATLAAIAVVVMYAWSAFAQQTRDLQSGGLAPPPAMEQQPGVQQQWNQSETVQLLDESRRADSGRDVNWFYFNASGGFEFIDFGALKNDGLTYGDVKASSAGWTAAAGVGMRLVVFTFGPRFRVGGFQQGLLYSIGGEAALHLPFGSIEPYFLVGGDYAFFGSLKDNDWGGDTTISGFDIDAAAGLDYFVTSYFSVGGKIAGDFLFLKRDAVKGVDSSSIDAQAKRKAASEGHGIGVGFAATAVLGLHF